MGNAICKTPNAPMPQEKDPKYHPYHISTANVHELSQTTWHERLPDLNNFESGATASSFNTEYDTMRLAVTQSPGVSDGNLSSEAERLKRLEMSERLTLAELAKAVSNHAEPEPKLVVQDVPSARTRRCLALISHNNLKPAMQLFVQRHKEVLRHFKITGTASTMKTVGDIFGDQAIEFGPTCASGPLGGDAQIAAILTRGDLGGMIFFADPLSAHPHIVDVESLIRLANVHNVLYACNPTSGDAMVKILELGLKDHDLIPSFYRTLESPSVQMYKLQQQELIAKLKAKHAAIQMEKRRTLATMRTLKNFQQGEMQTGEMKELADQLQMTDKNTNGMTGIEKEMMKEQKLISPSNKSDSLSPTLPEFNLSKRTPDSGSSI